MSFKLKEGVFKLKSWSRYGDPISIRQVTRVTQTILNAGLTLMPEVPHIREQHGKARLIGGGDHFGITD